MGVGAAAGVAQAMCEGEEAWIERGAGPWATMGWTINGGLWGPLGRFRLGGLGMDSPQSFSVTRYTRRAEQIRDLSVHANATQRVLWPCSASRALSRETCEWADAEKRRERRRDEQEPLPHPQSLSRRRTCCSPLSPLPAPSGDSLRHRHRYGQGRERHAQ